VAVELYLQTKTFANSAEANEGEQGNLPDMRMSSGRSFCSRVYLSAAWGDVELPTRYKNRTVAKYALPRKTAEPDNKSNSNSNMLNYARAAGPCTSVISARRIARQITYPDRIFPEKRVYM
jgi:hypothetical protein